MAASSPSPRSAGEPRQSATVHCFIYTPLAYLCALEYIQSRTFDRQILNVLTTSEKTLQQVKALVVPDRWSKVRHLSDHPLTFLPRITVSIARLPFTRWSTERALRDIRESDEVLLSHLDNPYSRLIINRAREANVRVTVVDDGTATIEEFAKLKERGVLDESNQAVRSKGRTARVEEMLFSTAPIRSGDVQFFSFWPLSVGVEAEGSAGYPPKVLQRNELSLIRSAIREQPSGDMAYFIGQPLVRRGVIGGEEYSGLLNRLAAHYQSKGLRFVYFPHRNETLADDEFDFEIIRNDKPFEIFLADGDQLPRVIGGYYSSTLATTFHFFHDRVDFELYWGHQGTSPNADTIPFVAKMFEDIAASADNFSINRNPM